MWDKIEDNPNHTDIKKNMNEKTLVIHFKKLHRVYNLIRYF